MIRHRSNQHRRYWWFMMGLSRFHSMTTVKNVCYFQRFEMRNVYYIKCLVCSKERKAYGQKGSIPKYCSRKCASIGRRGPNKYCTHCKKILPHGKYRSNDSKTIFCDKKCLAEYTAINTKYKNIECKICGKKCRPSRKDGSSKYCSKACYVFKQGKSKFRDCIFCGSTYRCRNSKQKCCSHNCSHKRLSKASRDKWLILKCYLCGKEFHSKRITTYRNHLRKYCSLECSRNRGSLTKQEFKCSLCGKTVIKSKSNRKYKNKFCNWECLKKYWKTDEWLKRTKLTSTCSSCGKTFYGRRYPLGKQPTRRFCSVKCMLTRGRSVELICVVCGKKYRRCPCEARKGSKLCSMKCKNKNERLKLRKIDRLKSWVVTTPKKFFGRLSKAKD